MFVLWSLAGPNPAWETFRFLSWLDLAVKHLKSPRGTVAEGHAKAKQLPYTVVTSPSPTPLHLRNWELSSLLWLQPTQSTGWEGASGLFQNEMHHLSQNLQLQNSCFRYHRYIFKAKNVLLFYFTYRISTISIPKSCLKPAILNMFTRIQWDFVVV